MVHFRATVMSIAYDLTHWLKNVKAGDGITSEKLLAVSDSHQVIKQQWKRKHFGVGKKFRYMIMQPAQWLVSYLKLHKFNILQVV